MNGSADGGFRYQPSALAKADWLQVMQATADFERQWQRGQRPDPEEFVGFYPSVPADLLLSELRALSIELLSNEADSNGSGGESGVPLTAVGRYQQLELLRRGGMGEVYRAVDLECGRNVALKKIRRDLAGDAEVERRFHEEARLTAGLEHPGVIPIYGRGVDQDGLSYYVMRLISGDGAGTLQQSIRQFHEGLRADADTASAATAFPDLVRRVLDVANTMAYAHSRGVVHRDLKPANILIGPYGETLIADWGLARQWSGVTEPREVVFPQPRGVDLPGAVIAGASGEACGGLGESDRSAGVSSAALADAAQSTGRRGPSAAATRGIGTPGFAAPEQLQGQVHDAATLRSADVYSLGAVLQCVVTGRSPDQEPLPGERSGDAVLRTNSAALRLAAGGAMQLRLLGAICRRAMSEQSEHRYVSVEEFRDDLQRWLSGEPVLACVESWWERLLRWPRRHRMATAALISGLLISVLGGAVFLAVVTQQKNQLAERSAQLQEALRKSKQLLLDANEARVTAEHERAAGDVSRDRAERREQMAFHAISQFYELFTERPELRTSASMSGVREEVLQRSRRFYDQLYQEIEADLVPNQMSVMRLSTAALSLSKLEHDLGHQQQAVERLETAVRRLREAQQLNAGGDLNAGLDFQLARLISQQGQLGMTYSWFDQAGPQLREAVERLESLREHPGLTPEQREEAGVLWVRAMSALAWQLGIMGKTAEALPLAERAKQAGLTGSPVSANDALTRVQLHGNVALLLESSGKSEQSLAELALAEQAAEAAEKLLTKDTTAGFRTELAAVRSKVARSRVRLLQRLNRVDDAVAGLQQQLSADEAGIRAFTSSHDLRNAYGSTAIQLQKQLLQLSRLVEARQVAERWVELAEQMLKEGTETERDLVFLMGARHAAGHTAERCGDLTGAFEQYGAALSVCERTSMLGFRAPSLVYQVLELNCHLACVQVQNGGWSDAVDGFLLSAKQAAEELQRWPTQTEVKPENVLRQLQSAVDLLERLGFGAEAGKWKAELQERQLIP